MTGCEGDKNDLQPDDFEINGSWRLVKSVISFSPNSPSEYDYSQYDIIYEFRPDGTLSVSNNDVPDNLLVDAYFEFESGVYSYEFVDSVNEKILKIDNYIWWYQISKQKLTLDCSPLDGPILYFVKL